MALEKKIAFTWNPDPKQVREHINPLWTLNEHTYHLMKLKRCCKEVNLYPEYCASGKLHWHGSLVIKDQVKWFKSILPYFKYRGYVCVKLEFSAEWTKYIQKNKVDMEKILEIQLPLTLKTLQIPPPPSQEGFTKDILDLLGVVSERRLTNEN